MERPVFGKGLSARLTIRTMIGGIYGSLGRNLLPLILQEKASYLFSGSWFFCVDLYFYGLFLIGAVQHTLHIGEGEVQLFIGEVGGQGEQAGKLLVGGGLDGVADVGEAHDIVDTGVEETGHFDQLGVAGVMLLILVGADGFLGHLQLYTQADLGHVEFLAQLFYPIGHD